MGYEIQIKSFNDYGRMVSYMNKKDINHQDVLHIDKHRSEGCISITLIYWGYV